MKSDQYFNGLIVVQWGQVSSLVDQLARATGRLCIAHLENAEAQKMNNRPTEYRLEQKEGIPNLLKEHVG